MLYFYCYSHQLSVSVQLHSTISVSNLTVILLLLLLFSYYYVHPLKSLGDRTLHWDTWQGLLCMALLVVVINIII